jgi:hypothetical protein
MSTTPDLQQVVDLVMAHKPGYCKSSISLQFLGGHTDLLSWQFCKTGKYVTAYDHKRNESQRPSCDGSTR